MILFMAKITIKIITMNQIETITIKEYLLRKGITFRETNGELITKCVFCEKENHLYFNAQTGQYHCKVCQEQGNIFTLAKHFGDDSRNIIINYHYNNMENNKSPFDATLVEEYHNALPQEIRGYLNNRGISDEIIEKNKLGWGNFYGRNWITIPIKDFSGSYTFLKLRKNPLDKDDKESAKYMFYPRGSSAVLYGAKNLKSGDRIIVCEGEFDQMILEKNGIAAVTSTAGAGTFKEEWVKHFANCQEIHICFDIDKAGETGAKKVGELLSTYGDAKIFKIALPQELGESGDITDYFSKGYRKEDLFDLYAEPQTFDIARINEHDPEKKRQSRTIELVKILKSLDIQLFLNQYNDPCVAINGNGSDIIRLDSKDCEIWIQSEALKKGTSFGTEAVKNTKLILMNEARKSKNQYTLSVRVAKDSEGNIWYDLGEKAIKISANGWEITDQFPILFQKYKHQRKQVEPKHGEKLDVIFDFFNIKNKEDRLLLKVWIVSSFIPEFAHPVLVLFGEHGSAKSTTFKILKSLIDPSSLQTLPPIKDSAQFTQIVSHHRLACFDNFSSLKDDLSDLICRVCTGEGFSKRRLYSDDDDYVYNFQHVIGINGISNIINRADLLDRSLLIETVRIPDVERRNEEEIIAHFNAVKPEILGNCFDILCEAIKIKPTINLDKLPRMADFASWSCAISEAMGIDKKQFISAYHNNINKQNEEAINASPIGLTVIELVKDEYSGLYIAQPAMVLQKLKGIADTLGLETVHNPYWPKDPKNLWKKLSEIAPVLKIYGIEIQKGRETDRFIEIKDTKKHETYAQEQSQCADMAKKMF